MFMHNVHIIQFAATKAQSRRRVVFHMGSPSMVTAVYIYSRLSLNGPVIVIIYIVTRLLF